MGVWLVLWMAAGAVVLAEPPFSGEGAVWAVSGPAHGFTLSEVMAEIRVGPEEPVGWPNVYHPFKAEPGAIYEGAAEASGDGITGGYGAYLSVEFSDAGGKRVTFEQSPPARGGAQWTRLRARALAPRDAVAGRMTLVLHGRGTARFRDAALRRIAPPEPAAPPDMPVTLTATDEVVCASLFGIGAEDDGWFYNEENAAHGVTEADHALREARIEAMDPDWIRMFFWYQDWNPSGDWTTFDFDSPNMRSHYRTLDVYQRIGASVTVTGVEWKMKAPFSNPAALAHAVGELLEHLIRVRGYTCVRHWILSNEPNSHWHRHGVRFDDYVEIHRLVREEIRRRGLGVQIMGSDETNDDFAWFAQCAASPVYLDSVDYFASHRYLHRDALRLAGPFFEERMNLLAGRKPLVIAEFGFQDHRSGTLENPLMDEFDYALWASAFFIDGLNRGVAGFAIWCMHEMYYPGDAFMNYGLWKFRPVSAANGAAPWPVRPVYHAVESFTRYTEPGMPVRRMLSAHPEVHAVRVGDTVFWVNLLEKPVEVHISGSRLDEGVGASEGSAGEADFKKFEIRENLTVLSGRSFGRMR